MTDNDQQDPDEGAAKALATIWGMRDQLDALATDLAALERFVRSLEKQ